MPVIITYPELDKISATDSQVQFNNLKNDFENFEKLVSHPSFPDNNYLCFFDAISYVNYVTAYNLRLNEDINYHKRTYNYRVKGGKYSMAPIWDFDWTI